MFNIDDTRKLLADAVATQGPDFIYTPGGVGTCVYVPWPQQNEVEDAKQLPSSDPRLKTGCIVGTALKPVLTEKQLLSLQGTIDGFWYNNLWLQELLDQESVWYFRGAQMHQDDGGKWGGSPEAGERFLAERVAERDAAMVS